mmetsp:Transcript_13135/g.37003  ORF Transcript_13135/g.37003 Transcript_13135/m.37003 type:complete len:141 (+) Transcript_13135:3407-3829(+)
MVPPPSEISSADSPLDVSDQETGLQGDAGSTSTAEADKEKLPSWESHAKDLTGDGILRSGAKVGGRSASWAVGEVIAACFSALATNRRPSQATLVARAGAARDFYPKFAAGAVKKGIWKPGLNGDPLVEDSISMRATFLR